GGYMVMTKEGGSLTLSGRACGAPVGVLPTEDQHRVYFYSLFPNLLLSLHPDYVMFHTLWPEGPGRTRITCEWLFHPDSFRQPGTSIRPAVYRAERHAVDERTTLRFLRLDDSPLMRSAGDVGHVPGLRVHTASRPLLL